MSNSIFENFYEKSAEEKLAEQAQAIHDRKKEAGELISFASDLTAEERTILQADLDHRLERYLAAQCTEPTSESPPTLPAPSSIQPPFQVPLPGCDPITAAFQAVAQKALAETKPLQKITPVEAMGLLLSRVCLRRYNEDYYAFNGCVFERVEASNLNRLIFHYLRDVVAEVGSAVIIKHVADLVKANPDIQATYTTDGPDCQYFLNGALDHGNLRPVNPAIDFFTTYCPFPYPTKPEETACPVFDNFLATTFRDDAASILTVWQMIGYLIVRDMAGKCFFVLQGVPNSGKSVIGNLVSELLNPDAVFSLEPRRFSEKYSLHGLVKVRLNVCMDLPNGRLNKESAAAIKQISGGDRITDEGKYANLQTAKLECKFLFGTNFNFSVKDTDQALLERLIVIPFRTSIPPELRDPYLLDKLRAERPAIAAKSLAAYQEVRRKNYVFALPRASEVIEYAPSTIADPVAAFLAECCDLCGQEVFTPTAILYEAYTAFCQTHGLPWLEQAAQFSRQLRTCCAGQVKPTKQRYNGTPVNGYFGICLRGATPLHGTDMPENNRKVG